MPVSSRMGICAILASMCVTLLCGCPGDSDAPPTTKVEGKVQLNGKPVADATVNFSPADPAQLRPAVGTTDQEGKYVLSSFEPSDGAMPGEYLVSIVPSVKQAGPLYGSAPQPTSPVPDKYKNPETSGLKATITADAEEPVQLNFDLE